MILSKLVRDGKKKKKLVLSVEKGMSSMSNVDLVFCLPWISVKHSNFDPKKP